jgi:hypothetical protein
MKEVKQSSSEMILFPAVDAKIVDPTAVDPIQSSYPLKMRL